MFIFVYFYIVSGALKSLDHCFPNLKLIWTFMCVILGEKCILYTWKGIRKLPSLCRQLILSPKCIHLKLCKIFLFLGSLLSGHQSCKSRWLLGFLCSLLERHPTFIAALAATEAMSSLHMKSFSCPKSSINKSRKLKCMEKVICMCCGSYWIFELSLQIPSISREPIC